MSSLRRSTIISLLALISISLGWIQVESVKALPQPSSNLAPDNQSVSPMVVKSAKHDTSRPLVEISEDQKTNQSRTSISTGFRLPKVLRKPETIEAVKTISPLYRNFLLTMPSPLQSFDGVSNLFGGAPPDTQGDIGPNHYVQWINLHFAVWQINKVENSATLVLGPIPGNSIFQGFGGPCESTNDGDPITLYDPFADRWFMSQFALPSFPNGPFYQCIAVSQTPDPTGSWYRYAFEIPVNKMNDYPKFGVWPDAYYMSVNQFTSGALEWSGAGVAAFERDQMLIGGEARMIYYDLFGINENYGGMLPADFDGLTPPPQDVPGLFLEWDDGGWIPSVDALRFWEFHVDWVNPANSTFGLAGNPNLVIPTADVDPNLCGYSRQCIPQPDTANKLDAISDRLMYRLQYRNFGDYESLVSNHTVDVDGTDHAGIHWFELRKSGGDWTLYQEGVHSLENDHIWMGSLALDKAGNLALGYSVSSESTYPSVRFTGRYADDVLGSLPQGEGSLVEGSGSQTGYDRWGDYSMMAVDPVDDCTFWYTQEYVASSGSNTWKTRIGSFRFPNCDVGATGRLQGIVRDAITGDGIHPAQISASLSPTQTLQTISNTDGSYSLLLPVGVYQVTVSAFAYQSASISGITVITDTITTQNFDLNLAQTHVISGTIKDAQSSWPLYGQVKVVGKPVEPVWSEPVSGYYTLNLPMGEEYMLEADAFIPGYEKNIITLDVLDADRTVNFPLLVDIESCQSPGYEILNAPLVTYDFEANDGGFVGTGSWEWGIPTSGPGTAHSGDRIWATNLSGHYGLYEDAYLTSPIIDLSDYTGQMPGISWWQWLETEADYDIASLEVSGDAGANWDVVYGPASGMVSSAWEKVELRLDSSYATSEFQFRFLLQSDFSITDYGWYVDDIELSVGTCQPQEGGLVVGNIYDGNTLNALNGAQVTNENSDLAIASPTPQDENVDDGFFTLFAPFGSQPITATGSTRYMPQTTLVNVPLNSSVKQDFYLPAGWLLPSLSNVHLTLKIGLTETLSITVANHGEISASMEWREFVEPPLIMGPFENPLRVEKPFKQNYPDASRLNLPFPPPAQPLLAGEVITSWIPTDVLNPWGIAYDAHDDTLWISSPSSLWSGNDAIYEYSTSGLATGRVFSHSLPHRYGPADLAYNWNNDTIWVLNVNSEDEKNCIFELDPEVGYTGVSICPGGTGFSVSQRGLAYDPWTDTWFAGGWNDSMLYRFDAFGNILSSVNIGLSIAGLAYNPTTQHLFVMTNGNPNWIYVLDVPENFAVMGRFAPSEGFDPYSGAGLEMDCQGNLWAVDQNSGKVVLIESGEFTDVCGMDIPWLSEVPISAIIPPSGEGVFWLNFDASPDAIDQPGDYHANLRIVDDTPYIYETIPITMTVLPGEYGLQIGPDQEGHAVLGDMITYTLTLTNTSEGMVDSFAISLGGNQWLTNVDNNEVGPLAAGDSQTITVNVHVPLSAPIGGSDTVEVVATSQGDSSKIGKALLTTYADAPVPDLEVNKSVAPPGVRSGELLTYTITITNHGPTLAGRVTLVDILPVGVIYESDDGGCMLQSSVLNCELGSMVVDAVRRVQVIIRPDVVGRIINHAVVAADGDPDLDNNWSIVEYLVNPWLLFLSIIFMP